MSNTKDKLGRTPLLLALLAGAAPPAVTELLNTGEDPSLEDDVGRTCTEAAVLYCSAAVVEIVIKAMIALRNSLVDSDGIVEIDKVSSSKCNERAHTLTNIMVYNMYLTRPRNKRRRKSCWR